MSYTVSYIKQNLSEGEIVCDTFEQAESTWENLVDSGECSRVEIHDNMSGELCDWWDLGDEPLDLDDDDVELDGEQDWDELDDDDYDDDDFEPMYDDEIGYDPYQGLYSDDV